MSWLPAFQSAAPAVAVRASVGMSQRLMRKLIEGTLDLAVIYQPELRAGLDVEHILDDTLVLVTADPTADFRARYIFVDWGEEFRNAHAALLPDIHNPGLTLDLGSLGIEYLIGQKRAGYFPRRIAAPYLRSKTLHVVADAPEFSYPAFAVYQTAYASPAVMTTALKILRDIARGMA